MLTQAVSKLNLSSSMQGLPSKSRSRSAQRKFVVEQLQEDGEVNTALTPRIGRVARVPVPGEELLRASNTFGSFNKSLQSMTEHR